MTTAAHDLDDTDFDALAEQVMSDPDARTAATENALRRTMATALSAAVTVKGLSVRGLAKAMGSSVSQVQRLLHKEVGGTLTLRTVVKAADALDLDTMVVFTPRYAPEIDSTEPWRDLPPALNNVVRLSLPEPVTAYCDDCGNEDGDDEGWQRAEPLCAAL